MVKNKIPSSHLPDPTHTTASPTACPRPPLPQPMAGRTDTQPSSPLSRAKRPSNPHLPCTILPSLLVVLLSVPPPPRASSSSTWGDPLDESCLRNLYTSLQLPYSSNDEVVLRNWTPSTFSSPCDGFTSFLEGATCNNGRVLKLSLRHLSLSGSISPFLSNCTNLQSLDLSSNSLTGPIPPDLSLLSNLAFLNLSRNRLEGPIPPGLSHCTYLNALDLHSNLLSGPIPEQLGLLPRLSFLDLSDNRLDGPVPALLSNRSGTGLPRFNSSSFAGNRGLYGYPLGPPRDTRRRGVSVAVIVGIGLGSGMVSLVLSFTVVCIWLRVTERREEEVRRLEEEEENHNKVAPKFD